MLNLFKKKSKLGNKLGNKKNIYEWGYWTNGFPNPSFTSNKINLKPLSTSNTRYVNEVSNHSLLEYYTTPDGKIKYIYHGVELPSKIAERYGIDPNDLTLTIHK